MSGHRARQSGLTLVIALVMLVVLTLLVVSAIRFGNINLKIAGNAQTETEASAATQVAVEGTIKQIQAATDVNAIAAQQVAVSTGGKSYTVTVSKPSCIFTKPVSPDTLDPTKAADRLCFGKPDTDQMVTASGSLTVGQPACKDQQWDVPASTTDPSGAQVNMLQGAALRVGMESQCP